MLWAVKLVLITALVLLVCNSNWSFAGHNKMEADFVNFVLRVSNYSIPEAPLYFDDYKEHKIVAENEHLIYSLESKNINMCDVFVPLFYLCL